MYSLNIYKTIAQNSITSFLSFPSKKNPILKHSNSGHPLKEHGRNAKKRISNPSLSSRIVGKVDAEYSRPTCHPSTRYMTLVRNLFAIAKAADRRRKQDKLFGEFAARKRGRLRAESCSVALEQGPRIYNNEVKPSSPKRVTFSQLSYASRYFYPRLRSVVSSRPSVRTVGNENIVSGNRLPTKLR